MKKKYSWVLFFLINLCGFHFSWSQQNVAPTLTATGNQTYCPGTAIKIVTNMSITDPDDTGIDAVYIQISSGFVLAQDQLTLTGSHPTITSSWNATTGVLTLRGVSGQPTYIDLIAAIEDIEFSTSSPNPTGTRNFSISVGQANYLPSNGHYYLFIPNLGIRWTAAKVAAEATTYYGLQGYLATLTSAEESQIAGEQTTGAGWIGGTDEAAEGVWKWATGPEAGTVFWNGNFTGSTPNYAFWNNGEPNNLGNENYAHVTAVGVGVTGSWNDLGDAGSPDGDYQPKGYIVEYGGMPGDPVLHISTSTSLTIPSITSTTDATRCESGTVNLSAVSNTGTVNWYDVPTGSTAIATGNSFTTPQLTATTTFYAAPNTPGCTDVSRTPVIATVIPKPIITTTSPYSKCDGVYTVISVQASSGNVAWYTNQTDTTSIANGVNFIVPNIHQDTVYYVEANNSSCLSNREQVTINVYGTPTTADETFELCEGDQITLDAGIPNMSYLWSTGETSQTIVSNGLTTYSVAITTPAPANCSNTKNFTINYHPLPVISNIDIQGLTVTINMAQNGDFEYSLDNQNFQSSNIFTVPEGGIYTCYVREKNQCGHDQQTFIVVSYPDFFTPNGDGINDIWYVKGATNFSKAEVLIFDRFGKMVAIINRANPYWNGTYNGKLLPASDYWFVAKINEIFPETKGHFALIR